MNPRNTLRHPFGGIYAATICPMKEDGRIDEDNLAAHLSQVALTPGMAGVLVNGHAGENFALTREELARVVRVARSVCGDRRIVAGVNSERADLAAEAASDAAAEGADAVMVFPPYSWALGADDRVVVGHHRAVAEASGLPMFLFQGAVNAGKTAFRPDMLERLLEIDRVVGIKEGSWETAAYEATRRLTRRIRPDVGVMASGDEHLLPCFVIGSDGSLVSLATVVPELIVALDEAVEAGDMAAARDVHSRLYELARVVYSTPGHLATLRLKTCLVILGRQPNAVTRSPIDRLSDREIRALEHALAAAGVLRREAA